MKHVLTAVMLLGLTIFCNDAAGKRQKKGVRVSHNIKYLAKKMVRKDLQVAVDMIKTEVISAGAGYVICLPLMEYALTKAEKQMLQEMVIKEFNKKIPADVKNEYRFNAFFSSDSDYYLNTSIEREKLHEE